MAVIGGTEVYELTGAEPLDLAQTWPLTAGITDPARVSFVFVQNTGPGRVYYAERDTAPAAGDTGHVLGPQDSLDVDLWAGRAAWVWTEDPAGGRVAVTAR